MTPNHVPDLVEGTQVHLDLGGDNELIPCTVLAFLGPLILARQEIELRQVTGQRLAAGAEGYILVEQDGRVKALRGVATSTGEQTFALRITDAFRLRHCREWSRTPLSIEAVLTPEEAGAPPVETTTVDISPTGIRVQWPAGTPVWPRYELSLSGDPLTGPMTAHAGPARMVSGDLCLSFTDIGAEDRARLVDLVVARVGERVEALV